MKDWEIKDGSHTPIVLRYTKKDAPAEYCMVDQEESLVGWDDNMEKSGVAEGCTWRSLSTEEVVEILAIVTPYLEVGKRLEKPNPEEYFSDMLYLAATKYLKDED